MQVHGCRGHYGYKHSVEYYKKGRKTEFLAFYHRELNYLLKNFFILMSPQLDAQGGCPFRLGLRPALRTPKVFFKTRTPKVGSLLTPQCFTKNNIANNFFNWPMILLAPLASESCCFLRHFIFNKQRKLLVIYQK